MPTYVALAKDIGWRVVCPICKSTDFRIKSSLDEGGFKLECADCAYEVQFGKAAVLIKD